MYQIWDSFFHIIIDEAEFRVVFKTLASVKQRVANGVPIELKITFDSIH